MILPRQPPFKRHPLVVNTGCGTIGVILHKAAAGGGGDRIDGPAIPISIYILKIVV